MQPDADLLVLGGGCAGLSLAQRLAQAGDRAPRVLVLEQRTEYAEDRTWCFWDHGEPWSRLASHQWDRVAVGVSRWDVPVDCSATPYRMVRATDFYHDAMGALGARVSLLPGVSVSGQPRRVEGLWEVATAGGVLRAPYLLDTRPGPAPRRGGALLWQSFAGHEIECDAPVFDPRCATLMDFTSADERGAAFTYVLPVSRTRALIEATVFGADPLGPPALSRALALAIAGRTGAAGHRVLRTEAGVLPMGLPPAEPVGWARAGVGAGAARPSTGYAFNRIQRWAEACAHSVLAGGPPLDAPADAWRLRHMDRLMLHALRARPGIAPHLFVSLFAHASTPRLLRFLSDRGSWLDCAAVAAAMPVRRFGGALLAAARPAARAENCPASAG